MCLKFSRTCWLTLVMGIYLELSIRNGICDDSQLSSSSYHQKGSSKGDNESMTHRHAQSWKGWEDWLPTKQTEIPVEQQQQQQQYNQYVPLSPAEQAKLRYRRNRTDNKKSSGKQEQSSSQSESSKNATEKIVNKNLRLDEGEQDDESVHNNPIIDLKSIRNMAKSLASSVINHFMSSWSSSPEKSATTEFDNVPRNSRAVYLDNLGERQDGPNYGKPEREAKRGVIDWLSRLIGVQGKTLGEFLREYQVHVLYDLAFTFFKWIFFLYAGLLIP